MDFEAPVDAWYVFLGVAIVSATVGGVVLGFPSTVPPDANRAANTIDRVNASTLNASASYEHDADVVWVGFQRLKLKNDGGVAHASVAFGDVVFARHSEPLERLLGGTGPATLFDRPGQLRAEIDTAHRATMAEMKSDDPNWYEARGHLRVRQVRWGGVRVTLVDA